MTFEIGAVLFIIVVMLICLIKEVLRPDFIVFCALATLLLTGILSPADALRGFSNEGMLTVALLFLIAGAVQQSGMLNQLVTKAMGSGRKPRLSILRMMIPVSGLSAFLNNTPIVVMFTPIVRKWCKERNIAPSKFLIPLSYAAIFGGTLTLIGTSTNLLVHGLLLEHGMNGFTMFQLTVVSLPACIVGILYMSTAGYSLLPSRKTSKQSVNESSREYLSEAVISHQSSLVYKTVKESKFRSKYDAGVVAVHRNEERINSKLGDIVLKPGDTILLLSNKDFVKHWSNTNDFSVMSAIDQPEIINPRKSYIALSTMVTMIILASFGILSMFKAALLAAIVLFVTKTINFGSFRKHIQFNLLILIACAIGIGIALDQSGAAAYIATYFIKFTDGGGLIGTLIGLYFLTTMFTEVITNNAAAVLMFPISHAIAGQLEVDPTAFFVLITIAASASFSTPIGYQTNLIVYGPGGYRFTDYLKTGIPLNLLYMVVTVSIVYWVWIM